MEPESCVFALVLFRISFWNGKIKVEGQEL